MIYDELVKSHPETLILMLKGIFYCAYNDCAYVLSALCRYQVIMEKRGTLRCGFPKDSLAKVLNNITAANVNYIVINGKDIISEKSYDNNNYSILIKQFDSKNIMVIKKKTNVDMGVNLNISESIKASNDVVVCTLTGIDQLEAYKKLEGLIQGTNVAAIAFHGKQQDGKFVLHGKIEYL